MERNREARRGIMTAATTTNGGGGGLSRRRQRNSSSFRESPEEDGRLEMPDTSRLRDRGTKKDRDRDRSSRSRRRRGERMLHGSNRDRDEGDESSEESMDQDEEDEDEGMSVPVRLPPSSPPLPNPVAVSSPQQNQQHSNHHHHQQPPRKSFPSKAVKWKADEMIGVPVPRKARSASTKRAHEPLATGGGGGVGEHITRQASISPSRLSPASTAQLSPSSSNGSLRKKMKPMSGPKHRPPKFCKSASLCQDEIEIEVAEVLFGMTRQFDSLPKQDSHKMDSRDIDGGSGNEAKSRVSSPSSVSPSPAAYSAVLPSSNSCSNPAPLPTIAPKRKRPRPVKFDEESPTSPVVLHSLSSLSVPVAIVESENQIKPEDSSPISEKNSAAPVKSGGPPVDFPVSQAGLSDVQRHESAKASKSKIHDLLPTGGSNTGDRVETKEELVVTHANGDSDVNLCETTTGKKNAPQSPNAEKFKFDLMAPPPGKLSPERDDFNAFDPDHNLQGPDIEMAPKVNKDKADEKRAEIAVLKDEHHILKSGEKDTDLRKQAVIKQSLDLQHDLEKPKEDVGFDKIQTSKQQSKDPKAEPKQEKSASSVHVPLTVGAWPGGFPPYGYMGQVPPLQAAAPINGTAGTSSSLQPPTFLQSHPRPKRCATHCFIAQMISNYQKFARMNSFWTAAAGAAPFYGAKPYNHTMVAPSDSALSGHQMQAGFLGANAGTLQDTKGTPVTAPSFTGNSASQEKMLQANNNTIIETAQRKQVILQQMPHSGSASNIPHGPAFIFPINQAQLLQPSAAASGAGRVGAAKSATTSSSGEVRTSAAIGSAVGSGVIGGSAAPVNLSFANMPPNDAQCVAFLQNYGYPFPIPAQFTGAPFRGTSNAQAMPFFYPPHMLHPQQLRPQQQQQGSSLPHVQQSHQNPSALSGSSHKHSQQSTIEFPATNQRQDLLPQQGRPKERSKGMDDNLPTADAAIHAGGHGDKQPIYQQAQQKQNMKVELTPQAFTIPFASYGGAVSLSTGLDFSMAQNHVILQSLPENSRHGYYQMASAPVAATTQATEQKKSNHESEDGKPLARQSMNTNMNDDEDRKAVMAGKGTQHSSLSFAKADADIAMTSVLGNSINDMSSRQVNLIQPLTSRSSDRPVGTIPVSTSLTATTISTNSHQQQQHPIHLPKHQQQQLHLASSRSKSSGSGNSVGVHPESLSGGSTITMFPHALTGFPQALVQGGSSFQWPQGKSSAGRGVDPAGPSSAPLVKNNFFQLQGRASQQSLPSQGHQTQISFGINGNKQGGQHLSGVCGSPSPSSATMTVLSPSNSRTADGSPRASSSVKPSSQASAILLPPQTTVKQSTSSSSSKSNMSNSTMPSILGHHPQKLTAPSSVTKQQQQPQQPKQQSSEAQLFFSNPHMQQVQCAQSNAAAQYYQKRPSEQTRQAQQQQQHNIVPSTSSMLSLCSPSALAQAGVPTTSDPAKALSVNSLAAVNNLKGLPPTSFLNAAQLAVAAQSASGSPRPPISATFSYMSLPPYSVKPSAEQKPTARTDNLQACWQPGKR